MAALLDLVKNYVCIRVLKWSHFFFQIFIMSVPCLEEELNFTQMKAFLHLERVTGAWISLGRAPEQQESPDQWPSAMSAYYPR